MEQDQICNQLESAAQAFDNSQLNFQADLKLQLRFLKGHFFFGVRWQNRPLSGAAPNCC